MVTASLDTLYSLQREALDLLGRAGVLLDGERGAALPELPALRAEMAEVLRRYQVFKHEQIFDPAVATGRTDCARLGRAMKIECIAAGETFRTHGQRWTPAAMQAEWGDYRVAARLTLHAVRRHLDTERDGIERLIALMNAPAAQG